LIDRIKVGNKELVLNDQQLASAVMEECALKEKYVHIPNKREAEKTTYIMHV
jgi:hypothetical protein